MANFNQFVTLVLKLEGGFQKLTSDTGNYNSLGHLVGTNLGISAPVYENWIGRPPTEQDMRNITIETSKRIYKSLYWDKVGGDKIKTQELSNLIADHAVNAGTGSAAKIVQRTLNNYFGKKLTVDGAIGNLTINEINSVNQSKLFDAVLRERERFYKSLNRPEFIKGWLHRLKPFYDDAAALALKYGKKTGLSLFFLGLVTVGFISYKNINSK